MAPQPVRVLGISGSLRRGSYNTGLLRAAADLLPEGMSLELFDLREVPLFDADLESDGFPPPVQRLRERIGAADGLLIAAPEYNYSVSGVLKNAIDWASRPPASPLDGKPLAMMGAGGRSGTLRAQTHLREIALHNSMRVLIDPEVFVPFARRKFNDEGELTDPKIRERISEMLTAFRDWIAHSAADPTLRYA